MIAIASAVRTPCWATLFGAAVLVCGGGPLAVAQEPASGVAPEEGTFALGAAAEVMADPALYEPDERAPARMAKRLGFTMVGLSAVGHAAMTMVFMRTCTVGDLFCEAGPAAMYSAILFAPSMLAGIVLGTVGTVRLRRAERAAPEAMAIDVVLGLGSTSMTLRF